MVATPTIPDQGNSLTQLAEPPEKEAPSNFFAKLMARLASTITGQREEEGMQASAPQDAQAPQAQGPEMVPVAAFAQGRGEPMWGDLPEGIASTSGATAISVARPQAVRAINKGDARQVPEGTYVREERDPEAPSLAERMEVTEPTADDFREFQRQEEISRLNHRLDDAAARWEGRATHERGKLLAAIYANHRGPEAGNSPQVHAGMEFSPLLEQELGGVAAAMEGRRELFMAKDIGLVPHGVDSAAWRRGDTEMIAADGKVIADAMPDYLAASVGSRIVAEKAYDPDLAKYGGQPVLDPSITPERLTTRNEDGTVKIDLPEDATVIIKEAKGKVAVGGEAKQYEMLILPEKSASGEYAFGAFKISGLTSDDFNQGNITLASARAGTHRIRNDGKEVLNVAIEDNGAKTRLSSPTRLVPMDTEGLAMDQGALRRRTSEEQKNHEVAQARSGQIESYQLGKAVAAHDASSRMTPEAQQHAMLALREAGLDGILSKHGVTGGEQFARARATGEGAIAPHHTEGKGKPAGAANEVS